MSHIAAVHKRRITAFPVSALIALLAVAVLAVTSTLLAITGSGASPRAILPSVNPDSLTRIGLRSGPESPSNPSGAAMPVGNLPGWKEVFSDDFTESVPVGGFSGCVNGASIMSSACSGLPASVAAKLWAYPDGWSDHHFGTYTPSQVLSIHNNMLDYDLHTSNGVHMVAAVVPKVPGGINGDGLRYGAYAIRFKATAISGYKTAFLLWPDAEIWPADGEIDFPEGNLNHGIGGFMHVLGGTVLTDQDAYQTRVGYSDWHTAVIEWTPSRCRFILDGRDIGTAVSLIPDTPMHWVLQAETVRGGAPADNVSDHIYIAWIAAYAPTTSSVNAGGA